MKTKTIELPALRDYKFFYDALEKRLKNYFRQKLYFPILKELRISKKKFHNAKPTPLADALFKGRVFYSKGAFRGEFNASVSKELKSLGATFDRKTSSFKIKDSELPMEIRVVIRTSYIHFESKMDKIDKKLSEILPEQLANEFHCADIFDGALWRVDEDFKKNVKKIGVAPNLTPQQRKMISEEWQDNVRLSIQDWSQDQIKKLRAKIFEDVMQGARKESLIPPILKITKTIQEDHEEALNKAKFLAHQETRLLMAKYKQAKYQDMGIHEYIWRTVNRPVDKDPKHHTPGNVRYSHGLLDGKVFRFDDPPITTPPGEPVRRNNAGEDYNCRCFSRALVRIK